MIRRAAALAVLAQLAAASACAQPPPDEARYGPPQRVIIQGYDGDAMEPFLSRDGATLLFNNRNDPAERTDLHWAERIDDLTFRYRGLVTGANSAVLDGVPTLSRDGRLCFVSPRVYAQTLATVHCGAWAGGRVTGLTLQPDVSVHVLGRLVFDVELDAAGERMIVADGLFRGGPAPATADLRQARRAGDGFRLAPEDDALFAAINTPALEYAAALSPDGLTLAFTRFQGGRFSTWAARRPRADAPFGPPARIAAITGHAEAPTFSPAGDALYFHRRDGRRFGLWRVDRER